MNPWNESSSPVHATPTKLTESPNFDCCLLDRGGFTIAGASSGSPEPEHRRLAGQGGGVEVAAADEWGAELQRGGGGGLHYAVG